MLCGKKKESCWHSFKFVKLSNPTLFGAGLRILRVPLLFPVFGNSRSRDGVPAVRVLVERGAGAEEAVEGFGGGPQRLGLLEYPLNICFIYERIDEA